METTFHPPAQTAGDHRLSTRAKSLVAGLALVAMLGGGAVTVFAASPDPSASPAPAASPSTGSSDSTTRSNSGDQAQTPGNCPHEQQTDSTDSFGTSS